MDTITKSWKTALDPVNPGIDEIISADDLNIILVGTINQLVDYVNAVKDTLDSEHITLLNTDHGPTLKDAIQWIYTELSGSTDPQPDINYVEADLSNNPKADELDVAFGFPTGAMSGYVKNTIGPGMLYHVVYVDGNYYYERLTKAH